MVQPDDRYARQRVLEEIGTEGQEKLLSSSVLIVGMGALGSLQAELLVRAGVGRVRIADRDVPEQVNLHRQFLFDEDDVAAGLPKAEAAARKLGRINPTVRLESHAVDVSPRNIESLIADMDLVLDGTDNIETRYLINDACIRQGTPWIYGGVIGTTGMSMNILPGETACLRCLFAEPPPMGALPTCETEGVLNSAPTLIGAVQVTEAVKRLVGTRPLETRLLMVDLWKGEFRFVDPVRDPDCPCCGNRRFDFLEGKKGSWATVLCGRNAVQIAPADEMQVSLENLQTQLAKVGNAVFNGFLLVFEVDAFTLLIFPDGRTIVKGTADPGQARSLVAKYVGC
ncbi:MAG: ThiF family adenylyltransferase [Planctomycetota bacterium]|jgi:adenylyltransferase/sulfurtransferase